MICLQVCITVITESVHNKDMFCCSNFHHSFLRFSFIVLCLSSSQLYKKKTHSEAQHFFTVNHNFDKHCVVFDIVQSFQNIQFNKLCSSEAGVALRCWPAKESLQRKQCFVQTVFTSLLFASQLHAA